MAAVELISVEPVDSPTETQSGPACGDTTLKPEQRHASSDASIPASSTHDFDKVPPEIISLIANHLTTDTESLQAFRAVNKTCAAICTGLLFRSTNLLVNSRSMAHLHCILGHADLRHVVTSIVINTAEYTDKNLDTFDWDDRDEELLKLFNHYLSRVGRFHDLRCVAFKFSKSCVGPPLRRHWWASQVPESVGFRTEALQSLFKGLNDAKNPTSRFSSLTIENLQDYSDIALTESEDFKAVMKKVKRLELQIATEHDEGSPMAFMEKKELHDFFGTQLNRDWLTPCAATLTHLKLYAGSVYWGFIPACRNLPHFPHLQSLCLGRMTFSHDWQLDWLLSHDATLEDLTLDNCPIVIGASWHGALDTENYPVDTSRAVSSQTASTFLYHGRWHAYFRAFRERLHRLRFFRCGFDDDDWERGVAFSKSHLLMPRLWAERYRVFDSCWLERPPFGTVGPEGDVERGEYDGAWMRAPCFPLCTDDDLTELVRLREVLCWRNGVVDEELRDLLEVLF